MLSKKSCKYLLRMCRTFIKLSFYIKSFNLSQPAISRFVTGDNYDEYISEKNLNKLCDEIYSSCLLYVDLYNELKNEKIA